MYKFHVQRHPFKADIDFFEMENTVSLRDAYASINPVLPIDNARFMVNDEIVDDYECIPPDDAIVCVKIIPGGGETWRMTGAVSWVVGAVLAVAGLVVGSTGLGAALGAWMFWVGVGMIGGGTGAIIIGNIVPDVNSTDEDGNDIYGADNSDARWQPVSTVFGEHYLAPDRIAPDWTSLVANSYDYDTVLHQLYLLGSQDIASGQRMLIDRICVGDTRMFNSREMRMTGAITLLTDGKAKITCTTSLSSEYTNISSYMAGFVVGSRISVEGCTRPQNNRAFIVASYGPNYIMVTADEWMVTEADIASMTLKYLYDTENYTGVAIEVVEDGVFTGSPYEKVKFEYSLQREISYETDSLPFTSPAGVESAIVVIATPSGLYALSGSTKVKASVSVRVYSKLVDDSTWSAPQIITIADQKTTASRKQYTTITFPSRGQWMLRFEKVEEDFESDEGSNTVQVYSVTCIRTDSNGDDILPVNDSIKTSFAFLAMSVYATDQLNGTITNLNCIVRRIVHAYDAVTGTWVPAYSNNPAAIFLDILINPSLNRYPIATGDIWNNLSSIPVDWDELNAWYTFCETNGFTCNGVLSSESTVKEQLEKVAITGRATFTMKDGLYTINVDMPKVPVQLFTPRNTHSFSAKRTFYDIPDGVRVKFVNKDVGYQQDETIIEYPDSAQQEYDELSLEYITDTTNAKNYGRYYLNVKNARQESFTFSTDFEYMVCTAGDRIKFQHDVPLFGMSAGRVSSTIVSGGVITGIVLDESVTMTVGDTYGIELRLEDAGDFSLVTIPVVNSETVTNTLTFITPQILNTIKRGDLLAFGKTGLITEDLLISDISCGQDISATITAVKYDEAIYDLSGFTLWDSNIGIPATASRGVHIDNLTDIALSNLSSAIGDNIGNKIFYDAQPVPPYRIGDMWSSGVSVYVCAVSRTVDEVFASEDWVLTATETFQTVSIEQFQQDNPEHRWFMSPSAEYPILQVHGFTVNSEVSTNVKENVLEDDSTYWEALAAVGVLTVPDTVGTQRFRVVKVDAKTADGQTSYIAGRWGLDAWHGEAFTNLIVSPDVPSTQDIVLEDGDYVLQTYQGTVTCSYGSATYNVPLSFTATAGSTTFTMASAKYVSLTKTSFVPPYVVGAYTANYNTYAITIPTVSGIAVVHNRPTAYSNIMQLYVDANNYILMGVIGNVLRIIRRGGGVELIHDYDIDEYIQGEDLPFSLVYDHGTYAIDLTFGDTAIDTLETWAYGKTVGADQLVHGFVDGATTYVYGHGIILEFSPTTLYVGAMQDVSAFFNNQIHMVSY